jgi:SAM-dependent methyltransferase
VSASPDRGPRCLLCGAGSHKTVFTEDGVDILRCRSCGHVFSSYPGEPHFDGFWGEDVGDDDHFYWRTARNPMYDDFMRMFLDGRSGKLLDMGCGLGFFLTRIARHSRWEPYGCEISPAAVRYARDKNGLKNIVCSRLQDLDAPPGAFDVITMWDVLDHLLAPDPLLRRCHTLLRDGGMCFIRTPNVRLQLPRARLNVLLRGRGAGLHAHEHLHHYSQASIRTLLERNGFTRIGFVHLRPVGAEPGASRFEGPAKRTWFAAVRALAVLTRGRANLDNLFVVAYKSAASRQSHAA